MKTEFGVYPNQPRRLADEVIAHFIFGWRWLPYQTSRQRQCWVFCPPSTQDLQPARRPDFRSHVRPGVRAPAGDGTGCL